MRRNPGKKLKKLVIHRETLRFLTQEDLRPAVGGTASYPNGQCQSEVSVCNENGKLECIPDPT